MMVFFGGAGVSTESGIPDFRSAGGLYGDSSSTTSSGFTPEEMLSHDFFMSYTHEFYDYYRAKMIYPDAKPNDAHLTLAELEKKGALKYVITQNIDGLHQMAGSQNVIELHGSVHRNYCMKCHKSYGLSSVTEAEGIPRCHCGGIIKPDVVLYQETLDEAAISDAVDAISGAEILIIGGTSLNVYPAAGLIRYFQGKKLILINLSETPMDHLADVVIHEKVGKALKDLAKEFLLDF